MRVALQLAVTPSADNARTRLMTMTTLVTRLAQVVVSMGTPMTSGTTIPNKIMTQRKKRSMMTMERILILKRRYGTSSWRVNATNCSSFFGSLPTVHRCYHSFWFV